MLAAPTDNHLLAQAVGTNTYTIVNKAILDTIGNISGHSGTQILELFLQNFVNLSIGLAGVVAFFFILVGGYHYIFAGGDKEAVQKATKTISSALIGLVIIFSIFAIIFVMETIFGISIIKFTIPVIHE